MKNAVVASFALWTALVVIPSALADSFGSETSGSNVVANLNINSSHAGIGTGVNANGTLTERNGGQFKSGFGGRTASNANSITLSGDGALSLANPLNSGNSWNGSSDRGDAVAEVSSNDLSVLSGGIGGRREMASAKTGYFPFAGKRGNSANAGSAKGTINQAATVVALAETPEPGSLFLLGTGLLCMALALFWKSAKRPTES
jgi:hypothetical protein